MSKDTKDSNYRSLLLLHKNIYFQKNLKKCKIEFTLWLWKHSSYQVVFTLITTHQRKKLFKILIRLEESGNMLSTLHFPLPIGAMANLHNKKLQNKFTKHNTTKNIHNSQTLQFSDEKQMTPTKLHNSTSLSLIFNFYHSEHSLLKVAMATP
jgi:hypothetical protein